MKKILLIFSFALLILISSCSKTESLYSKYSDLTYLKVGELMDGETYDLLVPVDGKSSCVYHYKVYDYQSNFTRLTIQYIYDCKYLTDGNVSDNILTGIFFNFDCPFTINTLESLLGMDVTAYRQGNKYAVSNYFDNPEKEVSSFVLIEQYLPVMVSNENREYVVLVPINVNHFLLRNGNIYNFIKEVENFEDVIEEYDFVKRQ